LKKFRPHRLLFNGQIQTVMAHLFARPPQLARYEIDTVTLADGDRINLHVDRPALQHDQKHLMLLLHGLGGCSESDYILRIGSKLNALGFPVIRFNHRGCGRGGAPLARSIYHAGRTGDLLDTLRHVKAAWPGYKISVAAFSLSGNMLLRFLGDHSGTSEAQHLSRAVAVCPPVDLELCSLAISARRNLHLDLYYTRRLIRTAHEKRQLFPEIPEVRFPAGTNLRLFDEIYTAKIAGFASRSDYYASSSARPVLGQITTETAVIYAKDDPIIPAESFHDAGFSSSTTVYGAPAGGHMGFVADAPTGWGDRWWMDEAVIRLLTDSRSVADILPR
jgi:hypothetical protein